MERFRHILSSLSGDLGRLRLLFFDTETFTSTETKEYKEQSFKMGFSIFQIIDEQGNSKKRVEALHVTQQSLLDEVLRRVVVSETLRVLANNVWFDIRVSNLLVNLVNEGFVVKGLHIKHMCVIIKMERNGEKIMFLNINQFVPGSVAMFGDLLGLPKLKIDLKNADILDLIPYCKRDTEIIERIFLMWLEFIRSNMLGRLGYTVASQAFIGFRRRFMNQLIEIHGDKSFTFFERQSYFGGRTEIFFQGRVPEPEIYYLDVNSMYPYIMSQCELPTKIHHCEESISIRALKKLMKTYFCIAQVSIKTTRNYYPLRYEKKLVFPVGKFVTFLCQPELELGVDQHDVIHCYNVVCYEKSVIFQEFVDYFYELRQKYKNSSNKVFDYITKTMMNSLYGKFGQRNDKIWIEEYVDNIEYSGTYIIDIDTHEHWIDTRIGTKHIIKQENMEDARECFVGISSGVTSYARILLLKYMRIAGLQNTYYTDTDSLMVNRQGFNNLADYISPSELGMLKLEKSTDNLTIHAPKDYKWENMEVIKGIPKNPDLAQRTSENSWNTLQFPGFRGDISKGMSDKYRILKRSKKLNRFYTKGRLCTDGKVVPLELSEW